VVKNNFKKFDTFPYHVMMSEVFGKKNKVDANQRGELIKVISGFFFEK
jgi:hypothetical protein